MAHFAYHYRGRLTALFKARAGVSVFLVMLLAVFASLVGLQVKPATAHDPAAPDTDPETPQDAPVSLHVSAGRSSDVPSLDALQPQERRKRASKRATRSKPRKVRPRLSPTVAGLTPAQTHNARQIVLAGKRMRVPYRGQVIALATALQESGLKVYANTVVPASLRIPHEAVGYDHDSVGLFQQRVPMWGSAQSCMTPSSSAFKFYTRLLQIPGWQQMPVTVAAQSVQGSAFPDAYADDASHARYIRATLF